MNIGELIGNLYEKWLLKEWAYSHKKIDSNDSQTTQLIKQSFWEGCEAMAIALSGSIDDYSVDRENIEKRLSNLELKTRSTDRLNIIQAESDDKTIERLNLIERKEKFFDSRMSKCEEDIRKIQEYLARKIKGYPER